ncbi:DUF4132 domain-containing protein [Mucilaginibacter flavidus]|uniref:DUF4132 domain-containing protein n=1 Tax=Mucilaginibacter flavidus TaxID=2949309 RepID=UPI002093320F|nr:DUF4132 domain-containing protein [Mucilaginibacter flavidus]MCO5948307.1 DUF4132 domain-containing protein [Mucilaginibacter flavidus]
MGIVNFLKQFLTKSASSVALVEDTSNDKLFDKLVYNSWAEFGVNKWWWDFKAAESIAFKDDVLSLNDKVKVSFIVYLVKRIHNFYVSHRSMSSADRDYQRVNVCQAFLNHLFKTRIDMEDDDFEIIINTAILYSKKNSYVKVPLKAILNQLQKKHDVLPLPESLQVVLAALLSKLKSSDDFCAELERAKLKEQVNHILFPPQNSESLRTVLFPGDDDFPILANTSIALLPADEKALWYQLFTICKKASGAKPSKRYLDEGDAIITQLGDRFKRTLVPWLDYLISLKEREKRNPQTVGNHTYIVISYEFISPPATECLKGLIWLCALSKDASLINRIALLADRSYRKIPGQGQTSTAIGNACLFTLYKIEGLEGISHLSRLKVRIKLASTLNLIEKYLVQAAEERDIPVGNIEDLAVDDFGLIDGERAFDIGDYKAILRIEKVGKISINWLKADGSIQKSEPVAIKEKHAGELKEIKLIAKQIEVNLSAQRDRIEGSFKQGRKMSWLHFETYYFNHGLLAYLSRKLIWKMETKSETIDAYWIDGQWINQEQQIIEATEVKSIFLWHPATSTVENVRAWRTFFLVKQIQQPIKQAFREIYLLTDAEVNTRTYSNRMAGHLLKQYQFNSLASIRGWKYTIQGQFDNGANGIASLKLPEFHLVAEYWTNAVDAENAINSSGIFNYVATDQVRFISTQLSGPVHLIDIPVVVFSEVMRDVDLFVGVASVGNDPNWRDNGGLPAYGDYWQNYSFGDLTEVAKSRKEILTRLLPRLKIAKVAEIRDKFLVVQGKKRTYKIHLGSTNILMEPNDQYLCIVPDRNPKNVTENLFLPFEGDNGLSVIISKALLLADDDKIKDVTITRQIER